MMRVNNVYVLNKRLMQNETNKANFSAEGRSGGGRTKGVMMRVRDCVGEGWVTLEF